MALNLPILQRRNGPSARINVASAAAIAALLSACAHQPQPPTGELVLNAADPVIEVELAGIPLRLRVDLDQQGSASLNPNAAARLPVLWEPDEGLSVGRVNLHSRAARAILKLAGRSADIQVAEYGRPCCTGADGTIGPDLLPYATVRWHRDAPLPPNGEHVFPLITSEETGLSAATPYGTVRLHFSLSQQESTATAAGGAILAHAWNGRWAGEERRVAVAFGILRPARLLAFTNSGALAGFRLDQLVVRVSDFAGDECLPGEAIPVDDVVVQHKQPRQRSLPAVTLGVDRLERCADIRFDALARSLTLRCAFDVP